MALKESHRKKTGGLLEQRKLLDKAGILGALRSIAQKILERHPDRKNLVLIGIRTGGVHLAKRLQELIKEQVGLDIPCGAMDITLYRDDIFTSLPRPEVGPTELPCSLQGMVVILVDDVLFTGRTIRAALEELVEFGRPKRVELAVLIDRGHREIPVQPDYVGLLIETTREQSVRVELAELGEADQVILYEKKL